MRLPERGYDTNPTPPDFRPRASSSSLSPSPKTNGHVANGCGSPINGSSKRSRGRVAKVELPGATIYDDSYIDREEYIRLVIQSLRDIGYMCVFYSIPFIYICEPSYFSESAATLEAESGYVMETSRVAEFRRCILEGAWKEAEEALEHLGVAEDDGLWVWFYCAQLNECCVLIHRTVLGGEIPYQSTEISRILRDRQDINGITRIAKRTCTSPHGSRTATAAFKVCRYNTSRYLAFLRTSSTSSLIMCLDAADLKHKAGWDGAHGSSRRRLLVNLQSGSKFCKYL